MIKRKLRRKIILSGLVFILLMLLACITLGSCQISYLTQAMAGHFRIMHARRPISKVLKDEQTDPATKGKLQLVLDIQDYAVRELGLPDNKSYTLYSEIKGEYPGWNVYCAPRFSVEPKTWCFPVAGCVVYHGYFKKEKAFAFAEKMKGKGFDVYVAPFGGYSTLGWYKDPILSTQLRYDSIDLAGLIIHELAHQEFYKAGDSRYNEGFAVTVERAGVLHWLSSPSRENLIEKAKNEWDQEDRTTERMLRARSELEEIYLSHRDTLYMLHQKDSILRDLEKDLHLTNKRLNNASLIPVSTYHSMLPYFQGILDSCGGDFRKFYEAVSGKEKQ